MTLNMFDPGILILIIPKVARRTSTTLPSSASSINTTLGRLALLPPDLIAFWGPLDRTYIGGIERGERNVALVNIEQIVFALRLALAQLFRDV